MTNNPLENQLTPRELDALHLHAAGVLSGFDASKSDKAIVGAVLGSGAIRLFVEDLVNAATEMIREAESHGEPTDRQQAVIETTLAIATDLAGYASTAEVIAYEKMTVGDSLS